MGLETLYGHTCSIRTWLRQQHRQSFRWRFRHADVLTGADSLNHITHTDSCTGTGGCCSLGTSKLCTVQLTVFITVRHLLILIATNLLSIRVAPSPL